MRHPFVRDRAPLDASSRRSPAPCEARPRSPVPNSSSSRTSPRSHRRSRPSSRRRWTPTREETRARGRPRAPSQPEAVAETPADAHLRVARRARRHRLATLARPRDGWPRGGSVDEHTTRSARRRRRRSRPALRESPTAPRPRLPGPSSRLATPSRPRRGGMIKERSEAHSAVADGARLEKRSHHGRRSSVMIRYNQISLNSLKHYATQLEGNNSSSISRRIILPLALLRRSFGLNMTCRLRRGGVQSGYATEHRSRRFQTLKGSTRVSASRRPRASLALSARPTRNTA